MLEALFLCCNCCGAAYASNGNAGQIFASCELLPCPAPYGSFVQKWSCDRQPIVRKLAGLSFNPMLLSVLHAVFDKCMA